MKRFTALLVIFPLLILVLAAGCERRAEDKTPESTAPVAEKQPEPEKPAKAVPESAKEAAEAVKKLPVAEFPSFADLAEVLKPSVVNISTTSVVKQRGFGQGQRRSPFGPNDPFEEFFDRFFQGQPQQEFQRQGLGSGFIISEDGYVVTNNHVVEKATDISVILENGDKYEAKVIGRDPKTDLAVIKFEPKGKLQAVGVGSFERLHRAARCVSVRRSSGCLSVTPNASGGAHGPQRGFRELAELTEIVSQESPSTIGGAVRAALEGCR